MRDLGYVRSQDAHILLTLVVLESKEQEDEEKTEEAERDVKLVTRLLGPMGGRLGQGGNLLSPHRVHLRILGGTLLFEAFIAEEKREAALNVSAETWTGICAFLSSRGVVVAEDILDFTRLRVKVVAVEAREEETEVKYEGENVTTAEVRRYT